MVKGMIFPKCVTHGALGPAPTVSRQATVALERMDKRAGQPVSRVVVAKSSPLGRSEPFE
jgi:hypothetical protein